MPFPVWPPGCTQESSEPTTEVECVGSCPPNIGTSEPVQPPATAGTRKKVARREKNYSLKEDEVLCSAYLNVSKDPIQRANQSGDSYWKKIHQCFHEYKAFQSNCTLESLQHRWGLISKDTARFFSFKCEQERRNESDKTEDDRISDAMQVFEEVVKRPFNYIHCSYILRGDRKWENKLKGVGEGHSKSKMPADTSATAQESEARVPKSSSRPIGHDAAKKQHSMEGGSSSSSACLEVLQRMTTNRDAINEERSTNIETMLDVEAKKLAAKLENNQLQRKAIEVQHNLLQYKMARDSSAQLEREERIMSMDLTHVNPSQRQYWKDCQTEIMMRRRHSST